MKSWIWFAFAAAVFRIASRRITFPPHGNRTLILHFPLGYVIIIPTTKMLWHIVMKHNPALLRNINKTISGYCKRAADALQTSSRGPDSLRYLFPPTVWCLSATIEIKFPHFTQHPGGLKTPSARVHNDAHILDYLLPLFEGRTREWLGLAH